MSNLSINRTYPPFSKKQTAMGRKHPKRTSKKDIELIKKISKTSGFMNDYDKWKLGINYSSKSKNKIKIGGYKHIELGEKFYLVHFTKPTKVNSRNDYVKKNILFNEIDDIDWKEYFLETTEIYKDIEIKNKEIKKQNEIINKYNDNVREIITKINKLVKWDDYVLFEGIKYGIPNVFENIHREKECNGLLKESFYDDCNCSSCRNWYGCSSPTGTQHYKCNNCGYEGYSKSITYHKNYKGK